LVNAEKSNAPNNNDPLSKVNVCNTFTPLKKQVEKFVGRQRVGGKFGYIHPKNNKAPHK
jgi:hypothetical protein